MTVDEIFSQIATHMIKGLMYHHQLSEYYLFLGLPGYCECHEYHYMEESCTFNKTCQFFLTHFNKLLPLGQARDPEVIPSSWYKYAREDVDTSTRRTGVKTGLEKWVAWETETKNLYEKMYNELTAINEIAAAHYVKELIKDVNEELDHAKEYHLNKKIIDFDMIAIMDEQKPKKEKYEHKKREMFLYK